MIAVHQPFPNLILPCNGGAQVQLADCRPKSLVLFTYGSDGTPSCTNEVMEFEGLYPAFQAANCVVLGLSKDSPAKHDKFIAKMGITLPLASDLSTAMEEMGAFGPKIFFGKPVIGVLRSTFLINGAGLLTHIWKVDRVKGHAAEVLAAVQAAL